jgi:hypothetical protein
MVNVVQTAFLPLAAAAAVGLAMRYRRATPDVRHQIKWVAYASLLTAVALLITGLAFGNPIGALLAVGPLIPAAAGIAIFKYRLYDIDVVISKTIVYGSLAAFRPTGLRSSTTREKRSARCRWPNGRERR